MGRRYTRGLAAAVGRRLDRYLLTLERLQEWPEGMPPLAAVGSDIGILRGLADKGFAEILPRDRIGDLRFRLTEAGRAPDAPERLKRMLAE
jgi:hypothetical protein